MKISVHFVFSGLAAVFSARSLAVWLLLSAGFATLPAVIVAGEISFDFNQHGYFVSHNPTKSSVRSSELLYFPRPHQVIFDGRFSRLASPTILAVATAMASSRRFASRKNQLVKFSPLVTEGSIAKNTPKGEDYISFSYEQDPLADVIDDLQNRYDLAFSYSPTPKLMEQAITARSGLVQIDEALDILFAGTPIEYRVINGRIAMRYSSRLAEELLLLTSKVAEPEEKPEPKKAKRPTRKVNTIFGKKRDEPEEIAVAPVDTQEVRPSRIVVPAAPEIPREETGEIPWQSSPVGDNEMKATTIQAKTRRLARVSILPGLSSSPVRSSNTVHTISFNLPAGLSGGLVGAELGVLFNGITGDMEGAQICGGFNVVNGQMTGVQVGLLGNGAGIGTGIQIGGVFNYCRRTLEGTQISSLLNVGLNGVNSQISVGMNVVQGTVNRQIGIFNRAVDVKKGQIGLINVADTVAGRSFGLINFVRKGYNNLETARTSVTPYASTLKLGSHRLYNVFEFGWGRRDLLVADEPENDDPRKTLMWSVGYGFGWTNRLGNSKGWRTNTEFVVSHLNRGGNWMDRLNLIGSIRYTFDIRGGNFNHFFFGPVMNLHFTQLSERELDGLFVSGWKLWSQQYDGVKFRGVLGLRFGLRIGRH